MRWITRAITLVSVFALASALTPTASAGRLDRPSLTLSGGETSALAASSGKKGQDITHAGLGGSVRIGAADLDPSLQVTLYKARWTSAPGFTGWEYLYYRGFDAAVDGTLTLEEGQHEAGSYRFQVCQYVATRKGYTHNCSDYALLDVS